ncbi:MAG: dihydroorotate dehydrogenase electron transfer subunit [Peptococcaceae bacterium]|jgi:dihydroorotate dehydrogenase electron transfer subunit|nr:dihydroorotate dehydrogenase electron transfer subunit [Peptococcaceae bacterium]MDH7526319.1 dihydroorotate dehydrogenase electron transfer subunit [Peptococcaceae bacterium]
MVVAARGTVIENSQILTGLYRLRIALPALAAEAVPGQFVMVKTADSLEPFLKRPLSINRIDRENDSIALVYQVVGRGTELLSRVPAGREIEVVGPLGNGFSWPETARNVALIGGGAGVAPLVALAVELVKRGKTVHALLGARSKNQLYGEQDFIELGCRVRVATEDGSCGYRGMVTDLLDALNSQMRLDMVYCCGPPAMSKAVAAKTIEAGVPCQVSLEERMGCGIGACLGCVCKVRGEGGQPAYKRVCRDGPVFTGNEVIFDG